MSSFGPKIPIKRDSRDGFVSLKTVRETVKQNLKMIILTNPGEKVMDDGNYGVGLATFLFSSRFDYTSAEIEEKIRQQVRTYLPIISIRNIDFTPLQDQNSVSLSISYDIPELATSDLLKFVL